MDQTKGIPASTNVRGAEYPRVHDDLRVTFRLEAPTAHNVQLQPGGEPNGLGKGPFDMRKDESGGWTVTTPPAVPGFHYYWLLVDGVMMNDPGSETFFGYGKPTSAVEIPEAGTDFYDIQNVAHGEVRSRWYWAETTHGWRRAVIYTPPAYDNDPAISFPVLYLQHGAGEDERGWTTQGRANFILDNIIARGEALPMIVVMECGYAAPPAKALPSGPDMLRAVVEGFQNVLLHDLIPMVDRTYRTIADREHRALAGLSMGSWQALHIGLANLDCFASIGMFSVPMLENLDLSTGFNGIFNNPAEFQRQVRLFWLSAGSEETWFMDGLKQFQKALADRQIALETYESQGTAHEWLTWRRSLHMFAPRLFRD